MMRQREGVFVDSGAWIALAIEGDAMHDAAVELWELLRRNGARLYTSIPVVIETFTFLDRIANRNAALSWKGAIDELRLKLLQCDRRDLENAWDFFRSTEFHKLSAVDATSFVLMKRNRIGLAFTFDYHFAVAGFRLVS